MNPLVSDYLKRKQLAEQEKAKLAQTAQNQELLAAGLKGAGALINNDSGPVIYYSGWNESTPQSARQTNVEVDTRPLEAMAQRNIDAGEQAYNQNLESFNTEQQLQDLHQKRQDDDIERQRQDKEYSRQLTQQSSEDSVSSEESRLAQEMASKMIPGKDFSKLSANQLKAMLPTINKIYDTELRKREISNNNALRQEERQMRAEDRQAQLEAKIAEKNELLNTPFGMARTADDAKKIKEAYEKKAKFDRIMTEMIALREKHNGGATLNREDVARGKQLAGDAKIIYKDLANLGVLSASDNVLIDQVIPADPLEYNLAGLVGQDPTKTKLSKFQSDINSDYQTTLNNRLRDQPQPQPQPQAFPREVRDDKGNIATVSNEQELQEALNEGFK